MVQLANQPMYSGRTRPFLQFEKPHVCELSITSFLGSASRRPENGPKIETSPNTEPRLLASGHYRKALLLDPQGQ